MYSESDNQNGNHGGKNIYEAQGSRHGQLETIFDKRGQLAHGLEYRPKDEHVGSDSEDDCEYQPDEEQEANL